MQNKAWKHAYDVSDKACTCEPGSSAGTLAATVTEIKASNAKLTVSASALSFFKAKTKADMPWDPTSTFTDERQSAWRPNLVILRKTLQHPDGPAPVVQQRRIHNPVAQALNLK
jgi:hypothetical protein